MTAAQIVEKLREKFGDQILAFDEKAIDPVVKIAPPAVHDICTFLKNDPDLYFDMCHDVSGYDLGPREGGHVPTVSSLWRTADWHEREAYDLFGIVFDGHPDPRRILCPDDWEGWPLRKDYVVQEYYHGIRVPYDEDWHKFDTLAVNPDRGHYVFAFEKRLPIAQNGNPSEKKE
jgi:NADH-quinone oxidoreductase subunit C